MIADFPDLAAGTDAEATYRIDAIAQLVAVAHASGARAAVHSTVPGAGQLVAAGVDSVEQEFGLDERAIRDMVGRGTAWTPTLGALLALLDAPGHHARALGMAAGGPWRGYRIAPAGRPAGRAGAIRWSRHFAPRRRHADHLSRGVPALAAGPAPQVRRRMAHAARQVRDTVR